MPKETAFELANSSIRFGRGVTAEVGMDLAELKVRNVMVVADPNLRSSLPVTTVLESLETHRVPFKLFNAVRIEPTDESFQEGIRFATEGEFDAFVAVGGGSTIDTAKAANLYSTFPAEFLDYVNPPIGKGLPVPGPLKPLIAIPTTAGTGSETTGVAIFDRASLQAKTGIAHRRLKPTLGLIDPENTRSQPAAVAASAGLDVLSHALESYTAIPFSDRPHPERPILRPAYQGSNPISDLWSLEALRLVARYLVRAVEDPSDDEARSSMLLAASYAGFGFGNAGVHLPHGMSVILNAPAAFRFTAPVCPQRHLNAAAILGADVSGAKPTDAGQILAEQIIGYMQRLHVPNGLGAVGYTEDDIPALVKGTLPQHRVTKLSPRPATEEDLAQLFQSAMWYW